MTDWNGSVHEAERGCSDPPELSAAIDRLLARASADRDVALVLDSLSAIRQWASADLATLSLAYRALSGETLLVIPAILATRARVVGWTGDHPDGVRVCPLYDCSVPHLHVNESTESA